MNRIDEMIRQQRITNQKMDKILLAFKSWQAQDKNYHEEHNARILLRKILKEKK